MSGACRRSAALLIRMSSRPKRATRRVDHGLDRRLVGDVGELRPAPARRLASISAATASASSCELRVLITTAAPSPASASAIARPIRRTAPVIRATRPSSSPTRAFAMSSSELRQASLQATAGGQLRQAAGCRRAQPDWRMMRAYTMIIRIRSAVARARAGPPAPQMTGAPCRIRTCDLRIRSPLLYPAELRARTGWIPCRAPRGQSIALGDGWSGSGAGRQIDAP